MVTAVWSSSLIPVWPHRRPSISSQDLTTWFAMGKKTCLAYCHPQAGLSNCLHWIFVGCQTQMHMFLCFTLRCPIDNTYYAYTTGTHPYARFTFKAFQFLRTTNRVYLQCQVLICPASDYNSRCRRGCNKRVARDVGSGHESETLVVGPIHLKGQCAFVLAFQSSC